MTDGVTLAFRREHVSKQCTVWELTDQASGTWWSKWFSTWQLTDDTGQRYVDHLQDCLICSKVCSGTIVKKYKIRHLVHPVKLKKKQLQDKQGVWQVFMCSSC